MTPTNPTIAEKRAAFRALHAQGCFVIPNPWDTGSARYLEGLGYNCLLYTSPSPRDKRQSRMPSSA